VKTSLFLSVFCIFTSILVSRRQYRVVELKENPVLPITGNSGAVPAAVSPLISFLNSLPLLPFVYTSGIQVFGYNSSEKKNENGKAQKAGQARRTARIIADFLLSEKKQKVIHDYSEIIFYLKRKRPGDGICPLC